MEAMCSFGEAMHALALSNPVLRPDERLVLDTGNLRGVPTFGVAISFTSSCPPIKIDLDRSIGAPPMYFTDRGLGDTTSYAKSCRLQAEKQP